MNIFILTDLEGIAGVTDIEYMDRASGKYAKARVYLSQSIDLTVKTCFECGADNVYYLDGHGGGGNVHEDMIDPRAIKCSIADWQKLLRDGKIDCQLEIGSHARAGTLGGFLDHTLTSKAWFCHRINGIEMSEQSLHALLCGKYNVPVVGCTGDETVCRQVKEYIPEIVTGSVKTASCRNSAADYDNADEILTDTVKKALENYRNVSLYKLQEPLTIELTYYRSDMCDEAYAGCGEDVERVDARTLRKTVSELKTYEQLKF